MTVVEETTTEESEVTLNENEEQNLDETILTDDEIEEMEEDEEEISSEDESEKLKLKLEQIEKEKKELEEKNQKLYKKLKSGYKKHQETKTESLSKEEVKQMLMELKQDEQAEAQLKASYDDAEELLPEVKKYKEEKWLTYDEAYALVKGKLMADEGYRNQINSQRTANYGTITKAPLKNAFDAILSKAPPIAQKMGN